MKRSEIITLSTLGAIAFVVILLYSFVFAPLLFEEQEPYVPEIREGEGLYLNAYVSLYPEIPSTDIKEIIVENEQDKYSFYMKKDANGKNEMVIKGYEDLRYTELVFAYLNSYARLPIVPKDTNIYRDVASEKMAEYGLTEDTCQAKFTITYTRDGKEESQTVLIGNKIMSSKSLFYATVQGRNHVYTMNGAGVENAILKPLSSYINPVIYTNFSSASAAALAIDSFGIYLTNANNDKLKPVIMLEKDKAQSSDTGAVFYITCEKIYPQKVIASTTYITNSFGQLFTTFVGDEVVAIVPSLPKKPIRIDEEYKNMTDEEFSKALADYELAYATANEKRQAMLSEYGLSSSQEHFQLYAKGEGDGYIILQISKQRDDYFYVLSEFYNTHTVVKVKAEALSFIGEGEETAIKWAATNSVYAGFSDYLVSSDETVPTVHTIRIKTKANGISYGGYDVTFKVQDSPYGGYLIQSLDGQYSFDTSNNKPEKIDLFSTLYAVLIVMPKPQHFTALSDEQKKEIEVEENLLYELEVALTNGVCKKYSYYFINSGYALCVTRIGSKQTENGETKVVYDQKESVFETSVSHITSVARAYEKTLKGEYYIQNDFIG